MRGLEDSKRAVATETNRRRSDAMPRYFFDLHNDLDSIDDEGVEFANVADAHAHAVAEARNMVAVSATEHGKIDLRHHIDVRDESGATIGVIRFEEGVTVVREGAPV